MIKALLLSVVWLILIPMVLGQGILKFNKKGNRSIFLGWIIGFIIELATFEIYATPMIFMGKSFTMLKTYWFTTIMVLLIGSIIINIKNIKDILKKNWEEIKEFPIVLTIIFVVIASMQAYKGYTYMHEDYDDSNFVAKATITRDTDTMFVYDDVGNEYKGYPDRQVLSPFPIFTATISDFVDIHPTVLAHSIFPVVFLLLAYDVYYLLGNAIFKHDKKKTMIFLLFVALVYSFGDTTRFAASSRIIFRPWQGKSILVSVIIPFIIYLFVEHVGKEDDKFAWVAMFLTLFGSILLSTMSVMLPVIVLGILTVLFMIKDSSFGYLYKLVLCVLPNAFYAIMYLTVKDEIDFSVAQMWAIGIAVFIVVAILFIIRKIKFNMIFKSLTIVALVAFCSYSIWSYLTFVNPYNDGIGVNLDGEEYAEFIDEVGKESNIFVVTEAYIRFVGDGNLNGFAYMAIVFVTAYYFKKENENKGVAYALGLFAIIALCVPFNFYLSKIIIKIIGSSVYWRMFWLVPTSLIIAVACTIAVDMAEKNVEKIGIALMICAFLSMTGKWIYTEENFEKVGNKFKIPDALLEVIMVASADEEENKKLAGPLEAYVYTRQVDGNIKLLTGRSFEDNYGKNSLTTYIKEGRINKILKPAVASDVNYIIMSTEAINEGIGVLNERLEDYDGVEILCRNDSYTLYKLNIEKEVEEGAKK